MIFTHLPTDSYKNKVSKFIVMEKNNEAFAIIVNEFNAYFVNISKNLADSFPVADHLSTYLNDPSDNTFKFDFVTERDVTYIIHKFKKKVWS